MIYVIVLFIFTELLFSCYAVGALSVSFCSAYPASLSCLILSFPFSSFCPSLLFSVPLTPHCNTSCRSPLSEPDTAEEEKAPDVLHPLADLWAGETLSPAEVPGVGWTCCAGQSTEDDRRTSQNLVPKQTHQVEVKLPVYTRWYKIYRTCAEQTFFIKDCVSIWFLGGVRKTICVF